MPKAAPSFDSLVDEYNDLYASCLIVPSKLPQIQAAAVKIQTGQARYEGLTATTRVPWFVLGFLHYRESDCDFGTHLYNGDPLTARTVHEPKNRPITPNPPYTFEVAATAALTDEGFTTWRTWTVAGILYRLEAFNGFGYRTYRIATPYLWSYSNHYSKGGFPRDHVWDPNYVSAQVGAGVLLKWMDVHGIVDLAAG